MHTEYDYTSEPSTYAALEELNNSDYEIVDGEPDITGWDVNDSAGNKIGEVADLLFDPKARKVRYIIVDTEDDLSNDENRKVLVPIGVAQLHTDNDEVIVPDSTAVQLKQLPAYLGWSKMSSEVESSTRAVFEPGEKGETGYSYPSFYEHSHFDEDGFYNRKQLPPSDNAKSERIVERFKDNDQSL